MGGGDRKNGGRDRKERKEGKLQSGFDEKKSIVSSSVCKILFSVSKSNKQIFYLQNPWRIDFSSLTTIIIGSRIFSFWSHNVKTFIKTPGVSNV